MEQFCKQFCLKIFSKVLCDLLSQKICEKTWGSRQSPKKMISFLWQAENKFLETMWKSKSVNILILNRSKFNFFYSFSLLFDSDSHWRLPRQSFGIKRPVFAFETWRNVVCHGKLKYSKFFVFSRETKVFSRIFFIFSNLKFFEIFLVKSKLDRNKIVVNHRIFTNFLNFSNLNF